MRKARLIVHPAAHGCRLTGPAIATMLTHSPRREFSVPVVYAAMPLRRTPAPEDMFSEPSDRWVGFYAPMWGTSVLTNNISAATATHIDGNRTWMVSGLSTWFSTLSKKLYHVRRGQVFIIPTT